MGQTDGRTDASPLHYSYRYRRGQLNDVRYPACSHYELFKINTEFIVAAAKWPAVVYSRLYRTLTGVADGFSRRWSANNSPVIAVGTTSTQVDHPFRVFLRRLMTWRVRQRMCCVRANGLISPLPLAGRLGQIPKGRICWLSTSSK